VLHPKEVGDRSTLAIIYALSSQGYGIYVPFGENTRIDLILEKGSGLRRVQCKTGQYRDGAVRFKASSSYAHHPNPKILRRDYVGEIDDFAVFCPVLGTVYLIPIDELIARSSATLRVDPPRNNQLKRILFAATYEIARIDLY
jgi:PD-(D/E)XK endonuclease